MEQLYNPSAPKKATNLSINSELLAKAKGLGVNLSATLELALAERVRQMQREQWLVDNREAIDVYNQQVEEHGVFSDGMRSF